MVTISPIIRDVVEKNVECEDEKAAYALRVRLATLTSSMGIYGSELIPWHCFPVFFAKIASSVYPLHEFTAMDIISKNYMSFIVIGSIIILSFTGLDRVCPHVWTSRQKAGPPEKGNGKSCINFPLFQAHWDKGIGKQRCPNAEISAGRCCFLTEKFN